MPERVPYELSDQIIDCLWADKGSLLNCALVCQNWLPRSRHNLFKHVSIPSVAAYDRFVDGVLRSDLMHPWLTSVCTISLWEFQADVDDDDEQNQGGRVDRGLRWTQRFIHDFAGRLPRLENLGLHRADWVEVPPHPSASSAMTRFSSLRILSITECKVSSFHTLRRLLTASCSLEELTLFHVSWPPVSVSQVQGTAPLVPYSPTGHPSLVTFTYGSDSSNKHCDVVLFGWLSQTGSPQSLRSFTFYGGAKALEDVDLHAVAPNITMLSLVLSDFDTVPPLELRSLRSLILETTTGHSSGFWANLSQMLSGLRSPLLYLKVWVESTNVRAQDGGKVASIQLEDAGLELLDSVLDQKIYQDLQLVEISMAAAISDAEVALAEERLFVSTRYKLPRLSARRILQTQVWPSDVQDDTEHSECAAS